MNDEEVIAMLRQKVSDAGGIAAWCRSVDADINPSTVSCAITGALKHPPISILNALGLKRVVSYEPK